MSNSENKADPGSQQRGIQQQQDQRDEQHAESRGGKSPDQAKDKGPVQTSAQHDYPGTPLPAQHLDKPGHEADMQLKPEIGRAHV